MNKLSLIIIVLFLFNLMQCTRLNLSQTESINVINNSQSLVTKNILLKKILNSKIYRIKRQDESDEENNNNNEPANFDYTKFFKLGFIILASVNLAFIVIMIIIMIIKLCGKNFKNKILNEKNFDENHLSSLKRKIYWKRCFSKFSCYSKEFGTLIQVKYSKFLKIILNLDFVNLRGIYS
jgi:hypothetical protein